MKTIWQQINSNNYTLHLLLTKSSTFICSFQKVELFTCTEIYRLKMRNNRGECEDIGYTRLEYSGKIEDLQADMGLWDFDFLAPCKPSDFKALRILQLCPPSASG